MNYKKIINYQYNLDENDIHHLTQTKVLLFDICTSVNNDCSVCPLNNVCVGAHDFIRFIDGIIDNKGESFTYKS